MITIETHRSDFESWVLTEEQYQKFSSRMKDVFGDEWEAKDEGILNRQARWILYEMMGEPTLELTGEGGTFDIIKD